MNERPGPPKVAKRLEGTFVEIAFESLFWLAWLHSLQPQHSIRHFGNPGLLVGHLPSQSSSHSQKEIMLGICSLESRNNVRNIGLIIKGSWRIFLLVKQTLLVLSPGYCSGNLLSLTH